MAASSYAAGQPPPNTVLSGRRFSLSLPFGCDGPAPDLAKQPSGWALDTDRQTLRVKVTPEELAETSLLRAMIGSSLVEAAEGFWIDRPWARGASCPPPAPDVTSIPPDRQSLAIVELFGSDSKRSRRRGGRSYEAVEVVDPGALDLATGLRLRLEGRLAGIGDGPPIGCWSEAPSRRPTCIVSARFERIAITDASGDRILAEWTD